MTSRQVAEVLGVDVSAPSRWAREGRLPCVRTPTGRPRFRRTDVEALLAQVQE